METSRLPFSIGHVYGGYAKLDGLLIVSPEQVTVEYQMKDNVIGVFSGRINTHSIALTDLERAECGLGFFSPWLALNARTLNTFENLPGAEAARLEFGIAWKYRGQLRALTSELNLLLSFRDADRYRHRLPGSSPR